MVPLRLRPVAVWLVIAFASSNAAGIDPPKGPRGDAAAKTAREVREAVKDSICYVAGKQGHGSGFLVREDVVVTNAHVIRGEFIGDVKLRFVDDAGKEESHPVRLIAFDPVRDLAVLQVVGKATGRAPLAVRADLAVARKPTVYVVGNPGQLQNAQSVINSLGVATVSEELVMQDGKPLYELTETFSADKKAARNAREAVNGRDDPIAAAIAGVRRKFAVGAGNSGGPVLDDGGRVAGVLTSGLMIDGRIPTGTFYAIPGQPLQAVIDGLGAPDTWNERSRESTARHALHLTAQAAYASLLLDEAVFEARSALWDRHRANAGTLKADADILDSFRKIDSRFGEILARGSKVVLENKELPADERAEVLKQLGYLNEVRPSLTAKRLSAVEAKRCKEIFEGGRKRLDKLAAAGGWKEANAAALLMGVAVGAGGQLVEK